MQLGSKFTVNLVPIPFGPLSCEILGFSPDYGTGLGYSSVGIPFMTTTSTVEASNLFLLFKRSVCNSPLGANLYKSVYPPTRDQFDPFKTF